MCASPESLEEPVVSQDNPDARVLIATLSGCLHRLVGVRTNLEALQSIIEPHAIRTARHLQFGAGGPLGFGIAGNLGAYRVAGWSKCRTAR